MHNVIDLAPNFMKSAVHEEEKSIRLVWVTRQMIQPIEK
jgi:hypothetical protein